MICKICNENKTDNTSGICWKHGGAEDKCPRCGRIMSKIKGIYNCPKCYIFVEYK